ncbi:restriction endonuclease subunit M [Spirochaetia bacterium]|nr:restriction endonuclease subunit M [Spirochaetia bacterium]GHU35375.1 restriction endonuclease subunit M [Spirochaetia bacterium]
MNYIGSKYKLLPFLKKSILSVVGEVQNKVFCDIFAGTGVVGRAFKSSVKSIISNDIEQYSYVLNKNYIENHIDIPKKFKYIEMLNNLPLYENGFIYKNYCFGGSGERQYFSDFNGKKIDTMRIKIEKWKNNSEIDNNVYYFLLCSLLESADKIANTTSVYGAFLKHIKKSAQKELVLEPALFEINENTHKVFQEDANVLIKEISGDILYMDPPYNERQYGANYHLLNTIAEYKEFTPKGKTGLRDYSKSKYCSKNHIKSEFENLIKSAEFKYLFLSYNNEGIMLVNEIKQIMSKYGKYDLFITNYQRFKADKNENRTYSANETKEYLHVLEKTI